MSFIELAPVLVITSATRASRSASLSAAGRYASMKSASAVSFAARSVAPAPV